MLDIDDRVSASIAKRDSGNFTLEDVAEYLQARAKPEAKVYGLKLGKWVKVGDYQLFLKSVSGNMDDAWVDVIVSPHDPKLNWLVLPFLSWFARSVSVVVWWRKIQKTNLLLDIWYVGDGSAGTVLVFEAR